MKTYLVLIPGTGGANRVHISLGDAKVEVERLLSQPQNIGKTAVIYESLLSGCIIPNPIEWHAVPV